MGRRVKSSKSNLPKKKVNQSRVVSVSKAPVAVNQNSRTGVPLIKQSRSGNCVYIQHREYLFDLAGNKENYLPTGPEQLAYLSAEITPTNAQVFPWLSKMAKLYEQFQFESLQFEYQPYTGTNNSGVILMAIDFDPSDDPPTSKTDMLAYEGAVRSAIWSPSSIVVPKSKLSKIPILFNRGTIFSDSSTPTKRQTAMGQLYVTSVSCPTALNNAGIGEIFVSYRVKLLTPQLTSSYYDQFSSRAITSATYGNPTSFFYLPGLTTPVSTMQSTIPFNIVGENTISINAAFDSVILLAVKQGVGITDAPTFAVGPEVLVTSTLVNWHNTANTKGVYMVEARIRTPGANITINIDAYATLSGLYFDVIPKSSIALEFGSTLS